MAEALGFLGTLVWERRYLVHVEDQVQFTNVFEAFIQGLHKNLGNTEKSEKERNGKYSHLHKQHTGK